MVGCCFPAVGCCLRVQQVNDKSKTIAVLKRQVAGQENVCSPVNM